MTGVGDSFEMQPIRSASVATLAYDQIRELILSGDIAPGTRLGQVDLADRLGISRTPVREALRRLAGEGLVDFQDQRGFRVAALDLDNVVKRLEVRLILEPAAARMAAERCTDEDLAAIQATIDREAAARDATAAHDASREFHVRVAAATQNRELVLTLEGLWLIEVGRRLLAQRATEATFQSGDVEEHQALLDAIRDHDGDRAAHLMRDHIECALQHWDPHHRP
jgi:DNA-binding GntR family transcriptional regulator